MPLFRFEFHENVKTDNIAVELVDHEAALAEAKRAAGEMLVDSAIDRSDHAGWLIKVYNDSDELIGTIFRGDLFKMEE
ncbi:hypothetical protein N8E89_22610 (plasmid) [Phyllobacterium sp. A18/5-2]|uniref:DUF6894 family protein n=1 Tax=Phyllobacterium sp. A18/5-2 TaxID=2978392 RepID=UPI0021CAC021|nr:hypothetical protein [Phyllobacterium sp. A18/5-2]UXN66031.1 hypothetical protein N8E89_22610 [Phyllobacterium sp. A18/5-2]